MSEGKRMRKTWIIALCVALAALSACTEAEVTSAYRSDLACPHADVLPETLLVPLEGEQ